MAVVSIPIGAQIRFTYPGERPDLRISGIRHDATALNILSLAEGVQLLQQVNVRDGFLSVESMLGEEDGD